MSESKNTTPNTKSQEAPEVEQAMHEGSTAAESAAEARPATSAVSVVSDETTGANERVAKERLAPKVWPIIWGFLFLAFTGWVALGSVFGMLLPVEIWIISIVLVLGVILLGLGISQVYRSRRS